MLADKDRIFTNIYGWSSASLAEAKKRGDWARTAGLMKKGPDAVIEAVKHRFDPKHQLARGRLPGVAAPLG